MVQVSRVVAVAPPVYAKVPEIKNPGLTSLGLLVWFGLCSFTQWHCTKKGVPLKSVNGTCYPSLKVLSFRCRLSVSSTRRGLRELERLGFVETIAKSGDNSSYNLYPCGDAPCVSAPAPAPAPAPAFVSAVAKIAEMEAAGLEVPDFLRRVAALEVQAEQKEQVAEG